MVTYSPGASTPERFTTIGRSLGPFAKLYEAIRKADDYIKAEYLKEVVLVDKFAKWRSEPASAKQLDALKRMGVRPDYLVKISRGDASRLLTKLGSARFMRRAA